MIDINHSRLKLMGGKEKKDLIGRNLFNHTAFLDEIKQQSKKGESRSLLSSEDQTTIFLFLFLIQKMFKDVYCIIINR